MRRNRGYPLMACLGICLTGMLLSCDQLLPLTPPNKDLPSELRFVVENKALFAQEGDDPIKDLIPGTIIDDLSTLDGCWGAAFLADVEVGGEPLSAVYFVEHYRASQGQRSGWFMFDVGGSLRFVSGGKGTFEVLDENRIAVESSITLESDPETGKLVMHEPSNPISEELLATLDGDRLLLADPDAESQPPDPIGDLGAIVYRRFDCPK